MGTTVKSITIHSLSCLSVRAYAGCRSTRIPEMRLLSLIIFQRRVRQTYRLFPPHSSLLLTMASLNAQTSRTNNPKPDLRNSLDYDSAEVVLLNPHLRHLTSIKLTLCFRSRTKDGPRKS